MFETSYAVIYEAGELENLFVLKIIFDWLQIRIFLRELRMTWFHLLQIFDSMKIHN